MSNGIEESDGECYDGRLRVSHIITPDVWNSLLWDGSKLVVVVDVQSSRRGRLTFEIQMQEKGCHLLSAESEVELDEWVTALKRAIESEDRQLLGDRTKDRGSIRWQYCDHLTRVVGV